MEIKYIFLCVFISLIITLIFSSSNSKNLYYEDLRFPAEVIKVTGASNTPSINQFGLGFDSNIMNQAFVIVQFPHSRLKDSNIMPHFHWHTEENSTGDVVWCIEYRWANVESEFDLPLINCIVDSSRENNELHLMTDMIILNGFEKTESSILKGRIFRNATDSRDTYAYNAYLLEFDIHYYNTFGGEIVHWYN